MIGFKKIVGILGLSLLSITAIAATNRYLDGQFIRNGVNTITIPSADGTFVLRDDSVTLTNKTMSGSSNTFTNIPNSATTATAANTVSAIMARDGSGQVAATTFTGALAGNATTATTATTATNATNGATVSTSSNSSFFPLFVGSSSNGNQSFNLGTGLTFNPSTNLLATTTFQGALTGTASGNTTYSANNHGVVLSGAGNTMTVLAPDASTIKVLTSGGTSADPTWATSASAPTSATDIQNLGLAVSASAGALTVNLKQSDGSTAPASGSGAVTVGLRSSTLTTGSYNSRSVTAALSQTLTSGTTLGVAPSVLSPLWVYALDSNGSGTMKIALSTTEYDDQSLQSTVAESFSATATSATPAVFTATSHGLSNGMAVQLTGSPPNGFSTGITYYVVSKAASTFQLSGTVGGTGITSSSTGSSIVVHMADGTLVSDAVYTSMPIRYIGRFLFNLASAGTWITSGTGTAVAPSLIAQRLERVERVSFGGATPNTTTCTGSPCTIWSQSGHWVQTVTRTSTGIYVVNYPGVFSQQPTCSITCGNAAGTAGRMIQPFPNATPPTSSAYTFQSDDDTATVADSACSLICMGPR